MMMVDTINPNTSEPDQFDTAVPPVQQPQATDIAADRFYGGFDKPDEVNINLAASGGAPAGSFADSTPTTPEFSEETSSSTSMMNDMVTPTPQVSDSSIESQTHTTYSHKSAVNSRGILVIVGIGLVATLIFSVGTYFVLGSSNADKLKKQQAQLDELNKKLAGLSEAPVALSVPEVTTPVVEPVEEPTTPVVTPVETPVIESTETTVPEKTENNGTTSAQAAG